MGHEKRGRVNLDASRLQDRGPAMATVGGGSSLILPLWARVALAVASGAAVGWYCYQRLMSLPYGAHDFGNSYYAAKHTLMGHNPYVAILSEPGQILWPIYLHPLTNAVAVFPLTPLAPKVAAGVFFAVSTATLTFALTRDGIWRLPMLLSAPFVVASWSVQFSPLLVACALMPRQLGWLAPVKVNLGVAAFAYRPSRWTIIGGGVLVVVSLLVRPTWPLEWLQTLPTAPSHISPVLYPFGFLALLAVLRWRTPEARLLLAMTLIPSAPWFYDHLMLWLVARTVWQMWFLTAVSWVTLVATLASEGMIFEPRMANIQPFIAWGIYLPALLVVLWNPGTNGERPNPAG